MVISAQQGKFMITSYSTKRLSGMISHLRNYYLIITQLLLER